MTVIAKGLAKRYGGVAALNGIDLAIEAGGIVGLLGPNGAGKTTLIEILEGLRAATSGTARVLGSDPRANPRALRARLGVQLQTTALAPELTALEALRLYAAFYPKSLAPREVLDRVGLSVRAGARTRTLSGGERQRLALALAMVHDPELYLLDEPTSGLDPLARRAIHEILRGLRARGKTVFLSSHHLDEIESLADRVVILRAGKIVADGTPLELLQRASGASALWIAVDREVAPERLLGDFARFTGRDGEHLCFSTSDPTAAVVALADAVRALGVRLSDLRLKRPTLEDLYVELVGPEASVKQEVA